jgi:hypothetical protein
MVFFPWALNGKKKLVGKHLNQSYPGPDFTTKQPPIYLTAQKILKSLLKNGSGQEV